VQEIIQPFQQYQVPLILLRKETPKEAVCQVFEKVNTGGVALTVFELLTATFAADNFKLRKDWADREKVLKQYRAIGSLENTDFLQPSPYWPRGIAGNRPSRAAPPQTTPRESAASGRTCCA
jgi:hypothetical protein